MTQNSQKERKNLSRKKRRIGWKWQGLFQITPQLIMKDS